jgi:hypothetical protein
MLIENYLNEESFSDKMSNKRFGTSQSDMVEIVDIIFEAKNSGLMSKIEAAHSSLGGSTSLGEFVALMFDGMEAETDMLTVGNKALGAVTGDRIGGETSFGIGQITPHKAMVDLATHASFPQLKKKIHSFIKNENDKEAFSVIVNRSRGPKSLAGDDKNLKKYGMNLNRVHSFVVSGKTIKEIFENLSDDMNLALSAAYFSIVGSIKAYIGAASGIKPDRQKRFDFIIKNFTDIQKAAKKEDLASNPALKPYVSSLSDTDKASIDMLGRPGATPLTNPGF